MADIFKKLTSRKLWMALAWVATGIALALGADTGDMTALSGGILSVMSAVTYILTEGKVDAERAKNQKEVPYESK